MSPETAPEPEQLVDHFFRHEAGRLTAWLSRVLGFNRLEQAEDIVQDTLVQALRTWRVRGVPENPAAWLYRAARHRALDVLRREQRHHRLGAALTADPDDALAGAVAALPETLLPDELADSQLRMLFACCHPALPPEAQLAMCLRVLCGLSIPEIAAAFLTSQETITKRLYRAKEKVRAGAIELVVPQGVALTERLHGVLQALYLLFNAGYNSSSSAADQLIRQDLCADAMRLTLLLLDHPATAGPATHALLGLMCLQASRFDARLSPDGAIVLLPDQDRTRWDPDLIRRGLHYLSRAATGPVVSEYHLEAAIAAEHCRCQTFADTNWPLIRQLYDLLLDLRPTPIVALHRAVAVAAEAGAAAGLRALAPLIADSALDQHYLFHAIHADLLARVGQPAAARDAWLEARLLTSSAAERGLIVEKFRGWDLG